jgi:hypothetical protein
MWSDNPGAPMQISIHREWTLKRLAKLLLGPAFLLFTSFAAAQKNFGELLDAGGKKLSPEEFKEELVRRVIVGPTATGGNLELMYTARGTIQGRGNSPLIPDIQVAQFAGEWKVDNSGRVCTSMNAGSGTFGSAGLPFRCQFWFKLKEQYFLADSDTDRAARVLPRTVKQ